MGTQRCPMGANRTNIATETEARWRGRPWQNTRAVLNGVLWVLGSGAQWRELPDRYPPYQTCHRRFQWWVREGKLERILKVLAQNLHARGQLQLEEAFIDASFTGAKKGASRSGRPDAARAPKSSLSLMITVFLSPLVSKALRHTKASSSKDFWDIASWTFSPNA